VERTHVTHCQLSTIKYRLSTISYQVTRVVCSCESCTWSWPLNPLFCKVASLPVRIDTKWSRRALSLRKRYHGPRHSILKTALVIFSLFSLLVHTHSSTLRVIEYGLLSYDTRICFLRNELQCMPMPASQSLGCPCPTTIHLSILSCTLKRSV